MSNISSPAISGAAVNLRAATPSGVMAREPWKIFQTEFVAGFERLSQIQPSVSIFGSARTPPDHAYYALTEEIARKLSDCGVDTIFQYYERAGFEVSRKNRRLN